MKTEIKLITPELAKEILKRNNTNRPIRKSQVAVYKSDMLKGQWKLTGQGIQIDQNGNLLDGQHRLHAIIESGISIPFLIVWNVPNSVFDVLDQGLKRQAADVLAINNIPNYVGIAAMIRSYLRMTKEANPSITRTITKGGFSQDYSITNSDIIKFYEQNISLCINSFMIADRCYSKFRLLSKTLYSSLILFLVKHKKHNSQTVENFMNQIASGVGAECNTIIHFRQKMINASASKLFKIETRIINKMITAAWNDYILQKNDKKTFVIDTKKDYTFI